MTSFAEKAHTGRSRGALRRWSVGVLACGALATTASSASAMHNMATANDGMACPHAAGGSGPAPGGSSPDAPSRTTSTAPIQGPSAAASRPSTTAPAPQAKAQRPSSQAPTQPAAATTPASVPASAANGNAEDAAAVVQTRSAAAIATKPATRRARRAAPSSRGERIAEPAAPRGVRLAEPAWIGPAAVAPRAAARAAAPRDGAPGERVEIGLGLLVLLGLSGGVLLLRRRAGGTPEIPAADRDAPSGADAIDLELQEMIAEVRARDLLSRAPEEAPDHDREGARSS